MRADNTSVIVVYFDEATQGEPAKKIPRLDTPESEVETETETKESTDSTQDSDKTPNQDSFSSEKPMLVRKLAFRCSNPMQLTSCVNHSSSNNVAAGLLSPFNTLSNGQSPVLSNCIS